MPHTITVSIPDLDWSALCHDLLDPEQWVRDAVTGKVAKCRERMVAEGQRLLLADPDVETMPASIEGLVVATLAHPGYRNRNQREAAGHVPD